PARSSTCRCFEMAGRLPSAGPDSSLTIASPPPNCSKIARWIGWANAANTASSFWATADRLAIWLTEMVDGYLTIWLTDIFRTTRCGRFCSNASTKIEDLMWVATQESNRSRAVFHFDAIERDNRHRFFNGKR